LNALGDLIEFLIGGFHIAIQHICDEEDTATGMVKGDDGVGE
jgi:hypothetical protein